MGTVILVYIFRDGVVALPNRDWAFARVQNLIIFIRFWDGDRFSVLIIGIAFWKNTRQCMTGFRANIDTSFSIETAAENLYVG